MRNPMDRVSAFSLLAVLAVAQSAVAQTAVTQTVDDGHSKEWQQFKPHAGVSWNSLAARCPQDGETPCALVVDGPPGDWIWATGPQVQQLMSYYALELATQPSTENFFAAQTFLSAFQPTFSFCITYQCGASGAGLTSSLDDNGVPIVGNAGWGTTPVSISGALGIGASGDAAVGNNYVGAFFFRHTGPGVFAYDDVGSVASPDGGNAVVSVLSNDWIAGVRATSANVALFQESTSHEGVQLDIADGSVEVASGTPAGTHTLLYSICDLANTASCDDAAVTVTVAPYVINAVDDTGAISPATGGVAIANVLANDLLGANRATIGSVRIATVSVTPANAGVALTTSSGAVTVAPGTANGSYAIVYAICETANPENCDSATARVTVRPNAIDAVNDYGRGSSKTANTPIASVLANDTLNGVRAASPAVELSLVSLAPASNGITLNLTTGAVSVKAKTSSGTYNLTYRICEALSPANCDTAVASIVLSGKSN
jgi:hypothetical protein